MVGHIYDEKESYRIISSMPLRDPRGREGSVITRLKAGNNKGR